MTEGTVCLSRDEQAQLGELCRNWEARLRAQVAQFGLATKQALKADTELMEHAARVKSLRAKQMALESREAVADDAMDMLRLQQDALSNLLDNLQDTLEGKLSSDANGKSSEAVARLETQSASLEAQLEALSRQTRQLAKDTAEFEVCRVQPMERVALVLEAHSGELDAVQERLDATELRMKAFEARFGV